MDLGLHNKVFIVGGSSTGLGLATARSLVGEGARVVIVGRRPDRVTAAVESLEGAAPALHARDTGPAASGVAADVSDPETPD